MLACGLCYDVALVSHHSLDMPGHNDAAYILTEKISQPRTFDDTMIMMMYLAVSYSFSCPKTDPPETIEILGSSAYTIYFYLSITNGLWT